ncbi:MAG: hypothetical protein ACU84Q_15780 [Gammaproteobacteria bacterium]
MGTVAVTDIDTHRASVDYRYQIGRHEFGSEFSYFKRNPDPGIDTDAWNLAVYWTYHFDRPARVDSYNRPKKKSAPSLVQSYQDADPIALAPGLNVTTAKARLGTAGISGASSQGGYEVYEAQVFPELFQRQRLVLGSDGKMVTMSGVIIGLLAAGSDDDIRQSFERVRKSLIDRYGPPTATFEEGEFSADFIRDVNAQRLIRIMEWETETGYLRFGIPRRRDGQVRMEVQHRRSFPQPRDTLWSIEPVR